jgi:site-specific DNA recombinase
MLAERSVARTIKRGNSPHLLTGLIFDDRGNPMSPTHANKKGVRYRYYTSHALLQHRKEHAGSVPRVAAPEVEALVCEALRRDTSSTSAISHKDLVAKHVAGVIVRHDRIEFEVRRDIAEKAFASKIQVPFSPKTIAHKAITREPMGDGRIDPVAREKLLNAIRRASRWVGAVRSGEAESFAEIAAEQGIGERHVRWLTSLGFLSPKVLMAVLDESAPAALTVARLAQALPHSWCKQEVLLI